jgi:hypothetical protein
MKLHLKAQLALVSADERIFGAAGSLNFRRTKFELKIKALSSDQGIDLSVYQRIVKHYYLLTNPVSKICLALRFRDEVSRFRSRLSRVRSEV